MPNPYEDLFEEGKEENKPLDPKLESKDFEEKDFPIDEKEPLDEILDSIRRFNQQAESFSQLLSQTRAVDHVSSSGLLGLFWGTDKDLDQHSLVGERKYHHLLTTKFETIIAPMRDLAKLHLETIKQFNRDIDKNYYSIEKTDRTVKSDKSMAIDGINLQRKILADACDNLDILRNGLEDTESRIKSYINVGGTNNISISEHEMIVQKRLALTSGRNHQFDYSFFDVNLLDKTVISLGIYMKKTSAQYLSKLLNAFDLT